MKAAQRISGMTVSPIRLVSEGAPPDAIPLGLGEPTWELAKCAKDALARFTGVCAYGPQVGIIELRRAVASYYKATPDEVIVTNGTQEGLYDVCQAFVDPGDVVLIPDPGFVGYHAVIKLAGGVAVTYSLSAENRFRLDAASVCAAIDANPKTRMVLIGHPANPTGGGADAASMKKIADHCEARGIVLVSDEVYRELYFGERPPSLRDVTSYGIVMSSVSKGFGAPGLRIGWMVARPECFTPLKVIHGYTVTSAALPAQWAALAMFENADTVAGDSRRELRARWDALATTMKSELGRTVTPPDGSFYHFMPLPAEAHADPLRFCIKIRDEAKVVLIPGIAFGENGRGFARLSFAARPEQLVEGVKRLAKFGLR
jgi:aspartate/methionine/tyrosine aminotransferase